MLSSAVFPEQFIYMIHSIKYCFADLWFYIILSNMDGGKISERTTQYK